MAGNGQAELQSWTRIDGGDAVAEQQADVRRRAGWETPSAGSRRAAMTRGHQDDALQRPPRLSRPVTSHPRN